jgi:hypothetical protein
MRRSLRLSARESVTNEHLSLLEQRLTTGLWLLWSSGEVPDVKGRDHEPPLMSA